MRNLLLFAVLVILPLLLGGCGEKSSPEGSKSTSVNQTALSEEVKPEEPVAETKPKLEGVNEDELEFREDIAYLKGSDTPYTGKFYELYPSGKRNWEGSQKDGKPDGLHKGWHENGQIRREENYKDGERVEGSKKFWNNKGEEVSNFSESFK